MFVFFNSINDYKDRLVNNTKINGAEIDTCRVFDAEKPYETAIKHPSYNNDKWIIVEEYSTIKEAEEGHKKWVSKFSSSLPEFLIDVSTSMINKLSGLGNSKKYNCNKGKI